MVSLKFIFVVVLLMGAVSSFVTAEDECSTPGECENPDASDESMQVPELQNDKPTELGDLLEDNVLEISSEVIDSTASAQLAPSDPVELLDPHCPSRPHIIRCASAYLDSNKNNKLERQELQVAIDQLPWYSRGILNILGSVDKIMKKCDYDGDDAIGIDYDMEQTKETCLATCMKRRVFKTAFFPECDL